MTMRSKQWYTKTSRLPNSFVNVSIGRPPQIRSCQHDHRSDGRWSQNFKYVWLVLIESSQINPGKLAALMRFPGCYYQSVPSASLSLVLRRISEQNGESE